MEFNTRTILIIVVILFAIYFWHSSKEHFGQTGGTGNNTMLKNTTDLSSNNINIHPMIYEPDLALITSASDFIGLPDEVVPAWSDNPGGYGAVDVLDDAMMGNAGLSYDLCSKSCCSPQYPPPFALPVDDLTCKSGEKFVGTSYKCNNAWQDSGCVCLTEKQHKFLSSRGGNGYTNYDVIDN